MNLLILIKFILLLMTKVMEIFIPELQKIRIDDRGILALTDINNNKGSFIKRKYVSRI